MSRRGAYCLKTHPGRNHHNVPVSGIFLLYFCLLLFSVRIPETLSEREYGALLFRRHFDKNGKMGSKPKNNILK
jgi:hypothetical protein